MTYGFTLHWITKKLTCLYQDGTNNKKCHRPSVMQLKCQIIYTNSSNTQEDFCGSFGKPDCRRHFDEFFSTSFSPFISSYSFIEFNLEILQLRLSHFTFTMIFFLIFTVQRRACLILELNTNIYVDLHSKFDVFFVHFEVSQVASSDSFCILPEV